MGGPSCRGAPLCPLGVCTESSSDHCLLIEVWRAATSPALQWGLHNIKPMVSSWPLSRAPDRKTQSLPDNKAVFIAVWIISTWPEDWTRIKHQPHAPSLPAAYVYWLSFIFVMGMLQLQCSHASSAVHQSIHHPPHAFFHLIYIFCITHQENSEIKVDITSSTVKRKLSALKTQHC